MRAIAETSTTIAWLQRKKLQSRSWEDLHETYLNSGFAIITWNNPKKLEKPCITKWRYPSIELWKWLHCHRPFRSLTQVKPQPLALAASHPARSKVQMQTTPSFPICLSKVSGHIFIYNMYICVCVYIYIYEHIYIYIRDMHCVFFPKFAYLTWIPGSYTKCPSSTSSCHPQNWRGSKLPKWLCKPIIDKKRDRK